MLSKSMPCKFEICLHMRDRIDVTDWLENKLIYKYRVRQQESSARYLVKYNHLGETALRLC